MEGSWSLNHELTNSEIPTEVVEATSAGIIVAM